MENNERREIPTGLINYNPLMAMRVLYKGLNSNPAPTNKKWNDILDSAKQAYGFIIVALEREDTAFESLRDAGSGLGYELDALEGIPPAFIAGVTELRTDLTELMEMCQGDDR